MMKVSSKAEIKDRIEKLYALAQGGATEGEAKAAIAMAEKLTVKYGISGINKNRYKTGDKGSRIGNATKSRYKTYTWDEFKSSQRKKSECKTSKSKSRDGWIWIYADVLRETEKAWLLNVHMDESKYGMDSVKVSIWMPKSQCEWGLKGAGPFVGLKGATSLVKKDLIMANLRNNLGWLIGHHRAFREHREFWLKCVGV